MILGNNQLGVFAARDYCELLRTPRILSSLNLHSGRSNEMLKQKRDAVCQICNDPKKHDELLPAEVVREPLVDLIRKTYPD